MQVCEKCGRPVKHIATGVSELAICDTEKLNFVTENGTKKSGYLIHDCLRKLEVIENEKDSQISRTI